MKLLIIAGPYEADRIRKAALSAGFETVAVEPGESLSGWITASRPELIVMAPQIVHADPALALAKVRAVPRGRVPIFLVGDAADEARLRDLADGFFVRPIAPDLLLERARAILTPPSVTPRRRKDSSLDLERTEMGLGPARAASPTAAPGPGSGGTRAARTRRARPAARSGLSWRPRSAGRRSRRCARRATRARSGRAGRRDRRAPRRRAGRGGGGRAQGRKTDREPIASPAVRQAARTVERPSLPPHPEPVARGDFAGETTKKVEPAQLGVVAKAPENARARLLARYAPVENGDYFAVLDVARDASAADLRRAHEKICARRRPTRSIPGWRASWPRRSTRSARSPPRRCACSATRASGRATPSHMPK